MLYAVAYDVEDRRRREKVRNLLRAYGWEVMPGVFECPLVPAQAGELARRIEAMIAAEDLVRVYQVCEGCQARSRRLGGPAWPERPEAYYL